MRYILEHRRLRYYRWSLAVAEYESGDVTYKQKLTTEVWNVVGWALMKCIENIVTSSYGYSTEILLHLRHTMLTMINQLLII